MVVVVLLLVCVRVGVVVLAAQGSAVLCCTHGW